MEPATDGKGLEKRLKVAALAWACTLTGATGFETPEPPPEDDETKIQRWQEGKSDVNEAK